MKSNQTPLVSIIIPTFNQGKLLARAIDSALAQSYEHKEIIVVNDGSPDAITRETAAAYGDRIIYIERPNGGVAAARNTGLEAAKGDLIALLDQDDEWLPGKLEKQVAVLMCNPSIGVVHSSYYLIDEDGRRTDLRRLKEGSWKPLPSLLLEVPVSSCTTLFPRSLINEVGPFDPTLNGSDDWDLWLRIAARGYSFYCVSEPLAEYRVHSGMTSRDDPMMVRAALAVLDKFYASETVPREALEWKDRAYFGKHAWGVSVYYGLGRLDEAREHLRQAAVLYPEGIAAGRFVRSLIDSRAQAEGAQPSSAMAREAGRFVLREARLDKRLRSKLAARVRLVIALYAPGGRVGKARSIVTTLLKNPALLLDGEVWNAARRAARRRGQRSRAASRQSIWA